MPDSATTPTGLRIAVLIDADNTSPKYVGAILDELAESGVATVKRAYGDWTTPQLGGWKGELNRHAIAPVQQFAYTSGKNSTDSALIIDAMDLLYSGNLDAFALVSSDSDFTRLATRLRESGMTVFGLGLRKTPESLRAAVDRFTFLEVIDAVDETASDGEPAKAAPKGDPDGGGDPLPDLEKLLTRAVRTRTQDDGWAPLGTVGSYLRSAVASFDPRNYGSPKLLTLLEQQNYLDVENTEEFGARVRLRSARPRKKTAKSASTRAAKV